MPLYEYDGSYRVTPARDLLTDGGVGPNRRLRVDVGQTGFFAGREFRLFHRFTANTVIQITVPVNTILMGLEVGLTAGQVLVETVVAGTPAGTFATPIPIFNRNNMTEVPAPIPTPTLTFMTGGTHTGGTVIDLLHVKAADNSNFAASVGAGEGDERGVAAGTYYFRLTVTGTTDGILKLRWEERP